MPARSAWPGRGLVSGAARASSASSAAATGSGDITPSHFGHSVLATRMATGPPTAGDLGLVLLELHPCATAVSGPPPGERHRYVGRAYPHSGGHPLADRDERPAVRFSRGEPAQHGADPAMRAGRPSASASYPPAGDDGLITTLIPLRSRLPSLASNAAATS